ncbi:MAG: ATP-binding protein [Calothrix sp. SM1_5_4]|nr:ATP-binding protein [Calothrix sp. SM1_5_4]
MNHQLLEQLAKLRLHTASNELEAVLTKHKAAANLDWAVELFEREIDARRERALATRIKSARFPEVTSLEAFDWKFNAEINESKIRDLARGDFIRNNQIALFLGKPGTGKTHLAVAIGILAASRGVRVYCTSVKRLIHDIMVAKTKNSLDVLFRKILSSQLWILDDWGVVSMSRDQAEEVFDLLDRRKHSSAMILTSNRDVAEWNEMFPDPVLANAAIDRIFDRAEVVLFEGQSYRMKGKIKFGRGATE